MGFVLYLDESHSLQRVNPRTLEMYGQIYIYISRAVFTGSPEVYEAQCVGVSAHGPHA